MMKMKDGCGDGGKGLNWKQESGGGLGTTKKNHIKVLDHANKIKLL